MHRSLITDVCEGIYHLHTATPLRVHGHLTSASCMVSDRWQVKVGDFGCLSAKHAVGSKNAADLLWTAPELLEEMYQTGMPPRCTPAGDIYR